MSRPGGRIAGGAILLAATIAPAIVAAEPAESVPRAAPPYLPGTLVLAALLALAHLLAPWIRPRMSRRYAFVGSFAGGMAVAYVFVHLLPEIGEASELLGRAAFMIALLAFVLYYGLGKLQQEKSREGRAFGLRLGQLWVYNYLIVYGTPMAYLEFGWGVVPMVIALVLHLVHADYLLARDHQALFDRWGRYVLAVAPLAAWAADVFGPLNPRVVNDVLVAIIAGSVLYSVFKEELPEDRGSRFAWFATGVVVFVVAAFASLRDWR